MDLGKGYSKLNNHFSPLVSLLAIFLITWVLLISPLPAALADSPSTPSPTPWFEGMFSSLPNPQPKSQEDFLVLPYYQRLRNGQFTPGEGTLLVWALNLPLLSTPTKLSLFNTLSSLPIAFLHDSKANPIWLDIILTLWQVWVLILIVLTGAALVLIYKLARLIIIIGVRRLNPEEDLSLLELSFPHDNSKSAYATGEFLQLLHTRSRSKTLIGALTGQKRCYGLEIVSSRDFGIRYIMAVPKGETKSIQYALVSFMPGLKIKEVPDYLTKELPSIFADQFLHQKLLKEWVQKLLEKIKNTQSQSKSTRKARTKPPSLNKIQDLYQTKLVEFKLTRHFALPLKNQKILEEHDPIAFITGHMAEASENELISFQLIVSPVLSSVHKRVHKQIRKLQTAISKRERISPYVYPGVIKRLKSHLAFNLVYYPLIGSVHAVWFCFLFAVSIPILILDSKTGFDTAPINTFYKSTKSPVPATLDPYEEHLHTIVRDKIHAHLFEITIRVLVAGQDSNEVSHRLDSLISSLGLFTSEYQSLKVRSPLPITLLKFLSYLPVISDTTTKMIRHLTKRQLRQFKSRQLTGGMFKNELSNPVLSLSEVSDLYHFPYTDITKTAGLLKSKSKRLPAPTSIKRSTTNLDVIVGSNTYGGDVTLIGMTEAQRERHTYIIGKTGMGKTEMLKNMIYQDMAAGKGLAVLDPHGDLFHELLKLVPKDRVKDTVVFNPADKDYPVGLNILLPNIQFKDKERGIDLLVSNTISVLQKITDDKYWGPRLEHILRNAAQTALFIPEPSLWTIQKLLTSGKEYQKKVTSSLDDPVLKQFWNEEFALFTRHQQSEVVSPVTNKLGKFLTSTMSRNILLQKTSTLDIQEIMDSGKILLVNLSKGELGEDQSHFFGSLITSLIQLAAYERINMPEKSRRNFYLYVDEFQNFATHIFEELSSEGRKWHVPLITSHQNIAQIRDDNLLKVISGNADTIICLKSGPDDEKFILPFMEPEVDKGEIVNLPPYHFYMKVTNQDSEDAFSGETEVLDTPPSDKRAKEVIERSRKHYAIPKAEVETHLKRLFSSSSRQPSKPRTIRGTKGKQVTTSPQKATPVRRINRV